MRTIAKWADLEPYGIDPLTGEACGLMYRILCDVTAGGRKIISRCLDMPDLSLAAPWNTGSKDDPHNGSIMLPPEMLVPLGLFALLESGCIEILLFKSGGLIGIEPNDSADDIETIRRYPPSALQRTFKREGTAGDRNRHQMTGRVT